MKLHDKKSKGSLRALLRGGFAAASLTVFMPSICGPIALAQGVSAPQASKERNGADDLRAFIGEQVGGLETLKVPERNEDLPLPRAADGTVPYRYELTEAKRYLGKLLFHDPVRTARIDINSGQPKDLPKGTDFGGTLDASDPLIRRIFPETSNATSSDIESIIAATKQTGSCGACHIGEAAGKAGQQLNPDFSRISGKKPPFLA